VDVDKVALASSLTELGQRLNEGHALDITDGTSLMDGKFQVAQDGEAS
jgi:hypothetical protein